MKLPPLAASFILTSREELNHGKASAGSQLGVLHLYLGDLNLHVDSIILYVGGLHSTSMTLTARKVLFRYFEVLILYMRAT